MQPLPPNQTTRRLLLQAAAVSSSTLLIRPGNAVAHQAVRSAAPRQADIVTRVIPRTSESVPVIGLGSFLTFDVVPGGPRDHVRDVMRRFWEGGGRVIDTSPLYGTGEGSIGDFATGMDIGGQAFFANKVWSTGDFLFDESHARRSLEQSMTRLWRDRIDLMQIHTLTNIESTLPMLRAWKKEGQIRYLGITHYVSTFHPAVVELVSTESLDFVQINYSIFSRGAEDTVIKRAAERGVAVITNMPFEKNRLFKVVQGRPLPAFARDHGISNWAEFFLKWVISNPAVTCCIPATSDPDHAAQNVAAMRGPLPDRALRDRMVAHMKTLPGFDDIGRSPWYPDKRYPGIIQRAQSQVRARA